MNHDFLNESEPARPKFGQTQANEKLSLLIKPPIQVLLVLLDSQSYSAN